VGVGGATRVTPSSPCRCAGRPRHRHDAPGLGRHAGGPRAGRGLDRHRGLVTFYFLGLSVGQLVYGPESTATAGARRSNAGYLIYALGALAGSVAPSLGLLLVARFVWGLGAAGPRWVTSAVIRGQLLGRPPWPGPCRFVMAIFVRHRSRPLAGYAVIAVVSWRWLFRGLRGRGGRHGVLGPPLPETLHPVVPARAERRPHRPRRRTVVVRPSVRLHGGDRPPLRRHTGYIGSSRRSSRRCSPERRFP